MTHITTTVFIMIMAQSRPLRTMEQFQPMRPLLIFTIEMAL